MKTRLRNCDSEASTIKRASHWLARVLAALSATNEAILSSNNVEEMLQKVIAAAVDGEGFLGAAVFLKANDSALLRMEACAGAADILRIAGEIVLLSPQPGAAKAETYFARALAVARAQQAKSWELRAAMSMARLWRDQGKPREARELLARVYGWFTEGFDTLDLKEAKALLDNWPDAVG
jgi:hypothetical protein